jgi:hypothetical protein
MNERTNERENRFCWSIPEHARKKGQPEQMYGGPK